jgi:PAB-dependent poly(A)-specific ribonuclease subunit 3
VYDYYPTAQTLYLLHVAPPDSLVAMSILTQPTRPRYSRHHHKGGRGGSGNGVIGGGAGETNGPLEERVLWSYVVQIANAMKEVHDHGLAFRTLDASKVLVTGKNRCVSFLHSSFTKTPANMTHKGYE